MSILEQRTGMGMSGQNKRRRIPEQRRETMIDHKTGTREEVGQPVMRTPPVVATQAWEAARQQMLVKEKALARARDARAAERRRMPWMAVEKTYEFQGPNGKVSLLDLFEGRRQLIVYRAFFEPGVFGWPEHACRGCSLGADQVAHLAHLNARDTTLAYVSGVQVGQMCDLIGAKGAAAAGMLGPAEHPGFEEGAVDDQLPAALEQVEQAHLAVRPLEFIRLLDGHPWHPPAFGSPRVAGAGQGLFLHHHLLARRLPGLWRHDRRRAHDGLFDFFARSCFVVDHRFSPSLWYPSSLVPPQHPHAGSLSGNRLSGGRRTVGVTSVAGFRWT